jgi:hypothetical protein
MPWISLAATRHKFKKDVQVWFSDPDHENMAGAMLTSREGRDAALAGDRSYVDREAKRAVGLLAKVDPAKKISPENYGDVMGLAALATLAGTKPEPWLENISKSARPKQPEARAFHDLAKKILLPSPVKYTEEPEPGHVTNDKEWFKLLAETSSDHAFDLSETPDHNIWAALTKFVLPLGYLVAKERELAGKKVDLAELWKMGPYPERRGRVIYERTLPKPKFGTKVDPEAPATWPGFDAVEIKGSEVIAYHYLGITWKAPIVMSKGLNAFEFLDHLDLSFQHLEESLTDLDKKRIQTARKAKEILHCVVFDSAEAFADEDSIAAAAEHYGVKLEVKDLTEV